MRAGAGRGTRTRPETDRACPWPGSTGSPVPAEAVSNAEAIGASLGRGAECQTPSQTPTPTPTPALAAVPMAGTGDAASPVHASPGGWSRPGQAHRQRAPPARVPRAAHSTWTFHTDPLGGHRGASQRRSLRLWRSSWSLASLLAPGAALAHVRGVIGAGGIAATSAARHMVLSRSDDAACWALPIRPVLSGARPRPRVAERETWGGGGIMGNG